MPAPARSLSNIPVHQQRESSFLSDVLEGLSRPQKALPAKYFYDLEGSRLFDAITRLPEYYPTRTELSILRTGAREIGRLSRPGLAVIEFGAGSSTKIRALLSALPDVQLYVPIDVSGEFVEGETKKLRVDHPDMDILLLIGDFTQDLSLPIQIRSRPRIGFFPGSTIGNFEPEQANALLARFARILGPGSSLIIGVDLVKPAAVFNAAYDDAKGVTARFNLNLLERINRELAADFDLAAFSHLAFFNAAKGRVEMHLVSAHTQKVHIAGQIFLFEEGETIHTENSYKYLPQEFTQLAACSGWECEMMLTDENDLFSIFIMSRI